MLAECYKAVSVPIDKEQEVQRNTPLKSFYSVPEETQFRMLDECVCVEERELCEWFHVV